MAAAASQPLPNHWQFLATKQTDNVLTRIIYKKNRQTYKQTNRKTDKQTNRQRPHENNLQNKQTNRKTDKQTNRQHPHENNFLKKQTKQTDNVLVRIIYKKNYKSGKSFRYILSGFLHKVNFINFINLIVYCICLYVYTICICVNHTRIILRYITITILRLCVMRW